MKFYSLDNGNAIPAIGLGTWKSRPNEVYGAVKEALKIGYRHIDCAFIYGNEQEIGQALKEAISSGEVKREELWITSKLWNNAHEEEQVIPALKQTLSDLELDYLDLYLIHWPVVLDKNVTFPKLGEDFKSLEQVPIAETWRGMEQATKEGLCRHIGVSNFSQTKLSNLLTHASIKPEFNQVESHPYLQQKELLSYCQSQGIWLTAYSPLGSPDRPESLKRKDEPTLIEHPLLKEIGENHQITSAQVLISWAINRNTVVIPKSVNPVRLKQNFEAAEVNLSPSEIKAIDALDHHYRFVDGSIWTMEGSPYTLSNLWDE